MPDLVCADQARQKTWKAMTTATIGADRAGAQVLSSPPKQVQLSCTDRRLLLAASFRLFLRRLAAGVPVLRSDVARLADYADEVAA